MIKKCCTCKQIKDSSLFSNCKTTKDGLFFQCKLCKTKTQKKYRLTEKGRTTHIDSNKRYEMTKNGKTVRSAINRRFKTKSPEKWKATNAVNHAISENKMKEASQYNCANCLIEPAKEYHHHRGYLKEHWLDVVPVCKQCHLLIHNKKLRKVS